MTPSVTYGDLTQSNPEYKPGQWARHRALYAGGYELLGNRTILSQIIPQNPREDPGTYAARLNVAEYVNYVGEILDFIVASLGADALTMEAKPPAPPFFSEFQKATDGHQMTLSSLMRKQILTALVTRRAWTLVDLPPTNEGAVIESAADEEQLDSLRALAFPVEPESVVDWGESPSGTIEWAIVKMVSMDRVGLTGKRGVVTERYTYYDKVSWQRYDVAYAKAKGPPTPNTKILLADRGDHSFGAVPLVPLELPEGLYALAKLANIAESMLRKRSGINWMQQRCFYPQLVAYLGPELSQGEIPAVAAQDPGRATSQTYGVMRVVQFGDKDKLEYLSPDTEILTTAATDLKDGRDEMHRIMSHMALATDNSAAALQRSGDSKGQDKASAAVILGELGRIAREHAVAVCSLASAGRKDPETTWTAHGMETFETADAVSVGIEATAFQELDVWKASQTGRVLYGFRVWKTMLQGSATPDDLKAIHADLEEAAEEEAERTSTIPPPKGDATDNDGDSIPPIPPPPKAPTGVVPVVAHTRSANGAT